MHLCQLSCALYFQSQLPIYPMLIRKNLASIFLTTLSSFLNFMDDGNVRFKIDRCLFVKPTYNMPQYWYFRLNIDLSVFQDSSGEDLLVLAIVGKFCAKVLWGTKYMLLWICITWFHSGMTISDALWTGLPCCYLMISLWNCF